MCPDIPLISVLKVCQLSMGNCLSWARHLILTLCLLCIGGCDYVLDCLDSDGPVFERSSLPAMILNQAYSETVRVRIRNEPGDNRFDYRFSLSGQLPPGLVHFQSGRDFIIEGAPTELGQYSFLLRVEVDDGSNAQSSGLCYTTRSKTFELTVQTM